MHGASYTPVKLVLATAPDHRYSCPVQDWIPDAAWLNVISLGSIDALRNISDVVVKDEAQWRAWYDQEAPERSPMPEYEGRLTKFERMCVVKVLCLPVTH